VRYDTAVLSLLLLLSLLVVVRRQSPRRRVKVLHRRMLLRRVEAVLAEGVEEFWVRDPDDCEG
jgi:hypothetical protein